MHHLQEDTIAKANAARRRAERELEENHEMTSTYEAEIAQLRSQLRRVRAVKDEVDNPDSPPKVCGVCVNGVCI